MKKLCNYCAFYRYRAGISAGLSKMMGTAPHPTPTAYCDQWHIDRERREYDVKPIYGCIKNGGYEFDQEKYDEYLG